MANNTSHNLTPSGIAYSIIITIYTAFIIFGLCLLWYHRGKSAIRIRGFLITVLAVVGLHSFVTTLWIVYPLGQSGLFKCVAEFWVMNTFFPVGIALFQASNVRLMAYATAQRCLIDLHTWSDRKQPFSFRSRAFVKWFKQLDYVRRTYFCIGMGLISQFIITAIIFHGSRRFNPTGGWFGQQVDESTCRRGLEWIPSAIWQFLWAWVFGPLVLYKTRKIQDTHYWALQTRLAVFSGLPGAPLWLAFLYSNYNNINAYWAPAMWYAPGLMMMQITTIAFPLLDIYRHDNANRKRAPSVVSTTSTYLSSTTTNTSSTTSTRKTKAIANDYDAFEYTLAHNLHPLLIFAATKDFTAENIHFLREVAQFKEKWSGYFAAADTTGHHDNIAMNAITKRQMFEQAARIYFELVCPTTSRCYINVDSKIYTNLERLFSSLAYEPPVEFPNPRPRRSRSHSRNRLGGMRGLTQKLRNGDVAPWTSPAALAAQGRMSPIALIDLDGLAADTPHAEEGGKKEMDAAVTITSLRSPNSFTSISRSTSKANLLTSSMGANQSASATTTYNNKSQTHGTIHPRTFAEPLSLAALYIPPGFNAAVFNKAEESIKYLVYTNTWKSFVADLDDEAVAVLEAEIVRARAVRERKERGVGVVRMRCAGDGVGVGEKDCGYGHRAPAAAAAAAAGDDEKEADESIEGRVELDV